MLVAPRRLKPPLYVESKGAYDNGTERSGAREDARDAEADRYVTVGVLARRRRFGIARGRADAKEVCRASLDRTDYCGDAGRRSGRGTVDATLAGNRLTARDVRGLRSPATVARIHLAPRAMRGPPLRSHGVEGHERHDQRLARTDAAAVQALDKGSLYIQVHSEKAPEGNLWGWLLPQEATK